MRKSKTIIDPFILNRIAESKKLNNNEKLNFLKYVGYMTNTEKKELAGVI